MKYTFESIIERDTDFAIINAFLRNDKVKVLDKEEVVLEPIGEFESLVGPFKKVDVSRNQIDFFYEINGVRVKAPVENGYKINAVEGNACYKKTYRYAFNRQAVILDDGAELKGKVEKVVDYGNQKYALLKVGEQDLLVEVKEDFAQEEVGLIIDGKDIEVWQQEIDFRIC